jgi:hypothetical protein
VRLHEVRAVIIYRVNVYTPHSGCIVGWAPSKAAARRLYREMCNDYERGRGEPGRDIWRVELPNTKAGLLNWLNSQGVTTTDNG